MLKGSFFANMKLMTWKYNDCKSDGFLIYTFIVSKMLKKDFFIQQSCYLFVEINKGYFVLEIHIYT